MNTETPCPAHIPPHLIVLAPRLKLAPSSAPTCFPRSIMTEEAGRPAFKGILQPPSLTNVSMDVLGLRVVVVGC